MIWLNERDWQNKFYLFEGDDSACWAAGGRCQYTSESCFSYRTGLCAGPANRKCCVSGELCYKLSQQHNLISFLKMLRCLLGSKTIINIYQWNITANNVSILFHFCFQIHIVTQHFRIETTWLLKSWWVIGISIAFHYIFKPLLLKLKNVWVGIFSKIYLQ